MQSVSARENLISIVVNGESRSVPKTWTIGDLLGSLDLDPRLVVVEHNRQIVRDRAVVPEVGLKDGDVLELVHFVGGG